MAAKIWHDGGIIPPEAGEKIVAQMLDIYAVNREPRLLHREWEKTAQAKLDALEKKTGKNPTY